MTIFIFLKIADLRLSIDEDPFDVVDGPSAIGQSSKRAETFRESLRRAVTGCPALSGPDLELGHSSQGLDTSGSNNLTTILNNSSTTQSNPSNLLVGAKSLVASIEGTGERSSNLLSVGSRKSSLSPTSGIKTSVIETDEPSGIGEISECITIEPDPVSRSSLSKSRFPRTKSMKKPQLSMSEQVDEFIDQCIEIESNKKIFTRNVQWFFLTFRSHEYESHFRKIPDLVFRSNLLSACVIWTFMMMIFCTILPLSFFVIFIFFLTTIFFCAILFLIVAFQEQFVGKKFRAVVERLDQSPGIRASFCCVVILVIFVMSIFATVSFPF